MSRIQKRSIYTALPNMLNYYPSIYLQAVHIYIIKACRNNGKCSEGFVREFYIDGVSSDDECT